MDTLGIEPSTPRRTITRMLSGCDNQLHHVPVAILGARYFMNRDLQRQIYTTITAAAGQKIGRIYGRYMIDTETICPCCIRMLATGYILNITSIYRESSIYLADQNISTISFK